MMLRDGERRMEIKTVDGKLSLASLFGPVAVGYGIGAGVIFVPMFLLMGLLSLFARRALIRTANPSTLRQ